MQGSICDMSFNLPWPVAAGIISWKKINLEPVVGNFTISPGKILLKEQDIREKK
jgi:hypothetical protein